MELCLQLLGIGVGYWLGAWLVTGDPMALFGELPCGCWRHEWGARFNAGMSRFRAGLRRDAQRGSRRLRRQLFGWSR